VHDALNFKKGLTLPIGNREIVTIMEICMFVFINVRVCGCHELRNLILLVIVFLYDIRSGAIYAKTVYMLAADPMEVSLQERTAVCLAV
jgi:hypothetical protein